MVEYRIRKKEPYHELRVLFPRLYILINNRPVKYQQILSAAPLPENSSCNLHLFVTDSPTDPSADAAEGVQRIAAELFNLPNLPIEKDASPLEMYHAVLTAWKLPQKISAPAPVSLLLNKTYSERVQSIQNPRSLIARLCSDLDRLKRHDPLFLRQTSRKYLNFLSSFNWKMFEAIDWEDFDENIASRVLLLMFES